ncbi:Protein Peter pan [Operophtera brumata]|uniref:Protein Peter pan n=1 Tax=Operophtera brumata TaxID=104452 RepID=A0A0L7KY18_OPEBR|nr:Protein Peter pan [Operophtera brumata]
MGKRKGKCVKKNPATKESLEPENLVKAPHSFVIHRGQCSKDLIDLAKDFRKIMEPFTASALKERKKNTIKDFVSVSGYLHYSLARDVISSLKKQYVMMRAFQSAPLIVLNSFSGEGMHMKLMASMFQNMFPTINITNSEFEDDPSSQIVLPQSLATRGAAADSNEHPNRKRKTGDDNEPRGFKKMRLDNKLKKKFQKNNDTGGKVQRNQEGGRKFQSNKEGGRRFQNQDGGRKFQSQDGGRKFHNQDGGKKFQNQDDLFSEHPNRKRKTGEDNEPRGFKKMRLDNKLKKKFQKNNDTGGKVQRNQEGGRKFQSNKEGGRRFQNQDGGRKFQSQDGGRKFHNQDGGKKFQNQDDKKGGGRNFQDKKGGRNFNNKDGGAKSNFKNDNKGQKFNKPKKVFGGKVSKSGKGKGGKSKGKGRK